MRAIGAFFVISAIIAGLLIATVGVMYLINLVL